MSGQCSYFVPLENNKKSLFQGDLKKEKTNWYWSFQGVENKSDVGNSRKVIDF